MAAGTARRRRVPARKRMAYEAWGERETRLGSPPSAEASSSELGVWGSVTHILCGPDHRHGGGVRPASRRVARRWAPEARYWRANRESRCMGETIDWKAELRKYEREFDGLP